jgi:hypothetical protein
MTNQTETSLDMSDVNPETIAHDIERLSDLASIVAAAQDALTDDMVTRLASAFSEGIILLDRLTRNEGLMRLLQVLDRPETQHLMISLSEALGKMSQEIATAPPAKGGVVSLYRLACNPGTQEGLRSLSVLGEYWSESLRELHRRGG